MKTDFTDLVSRKQVMAILLQAINDMPSAFEEPKKAVPRSTRVEDVEEWEHQNGIRSWKDRHHL